MTRKITLILITILFCDTIHTQTDSVHNLLVPGFRLYQNEKGKNVFYEFEKDWNLIAVTDSFFIADPNKYKYKVSIKDITGISNHYGSNITAIVATTSSIGLLLGFLVGSLGVQYDGHRDSFNLGRAFLLEPVLVQLFLA